MTGIGYQVPIGTGSPLSPALFGGSTAGAAGSVGVVNGVGRTTAGTASGPPVAPYTYASGLGQTLVPPDSSAVMIGLRANAITGMASAPSLLTAVAMRRGQPLGQTIRKSKTSSTMRSTSCQARAKWTCAASRAVPR
jgi:hypothetical protein